MSSDTPRTDAFFSDDRLSREVIEGFTRTLERDLAAATERIAALERERDALRALLTDWNDHAHGIGAKSQRMLVVETEAALGEGE